MCLHYRPETVHCNTKDAYTSEITFLALQPWSNRTTIYSTPCIPSLYLEDQLFLTPCIPSLYLEEQLFLIPGIPSLYLEEQLFLTPCIPSLEELLYT